MTNSNASSENVGLTQAHSIVGFGKDREPHDNYPTPEIAVVELLKREKFEGIVWECAVGCGNIAKYFPDCMASDIRHDDNIAGEGGVNFLLENRTVDNIVTNPPFRLAQQFVEHALKCTTKKVAMFLKLVFLESQSRYEMFQSTPLKTVYVFSKRINPKKEGVTKKMSGMIAYAWFVWEHGYTGKPEIEWILHDDEQTPEKTHIEGRGLGQTTLLEQRTKVTYDKEVGK